MKQYIMYKVDYNGEMPYVCNYFYCCIQLEGQSYGADWMWPASDS